MELHVHIHGDIHIHNHGDEKLFEQLNLSLQKLKKMAEDLKAALDRAEKEATENDSVIASAVTLFDTLSGLIRDTAGSAEKANALADKIDAQGAQLATAIAANTPAANPTPVPGEQPNPGV